MQSAIHANSKTGNSVDFTTDCPKRRDGKACKYCYVETARTMGYNAKNIIDHCAYTGEVKRFSQKKIDFLNECGGIRMFSFGDYMPQHDAEISAFLMDCASVGLKVKVITKQLAFVDMYHDASAIAVINISIDAVGDGVDHDKAKEYREKYSKVRIRSAIMTDADVDTLAFSDVFTFNHAVGLKQYGYRKYSKQNVADYAAKLGNRVCCTTGKCFTCPLKCAQ